MANYVKFLRGTPAAYERLTHKDDDTLYFIYEKDSGDGVLYLGSKLIAGADGESITASSINALKDVLISEDLTNKSLLVYDAKQSQWVNTDFEDLIFVGAQEESAGIAGLVPAPELGQTNLFLRSDGTWAEINIDANVSQNIINIENESNQTHAEIIAEATDNLTLAKGDIIIIKDIIIGDITQQTAYIYNGSSWEALSGNVVAEKVFFAEDFSDLETAGKNLKEVLELILAKPSIQADNASIVLEDNKISLKNYGIQYYKYVPESGSEDTGDFVEAHYELQIVNESNPWIAGLEPRVTLEDGNLVLGWYEPNPTTIDGVNSQVSAIQTTIADLQAEVIELKEKLGEPANAEEGTAASGIFAELDKKANAADVYNKTETEQKINEAVSAAAHLKRKEVTSVDDIDVTAADADQYIYMVPSGLQDDDNKYYEYMIVEIEVVDKETQEITKVRQIEQVGSWEVDLSDYAKKSDIIIKGIDETELSIDKDGKLSIKEVDQAKVKGLSESLQGYVLKIEGYGLVPLTEIEKLSTIKEGAEPNFIKSVDIANFTVDENGKLLLNDLPMSKIQGLSEMATSHAEIVDLVKNEKTGLIVQVRQNASNIQSIQDILNNEETGLIKRVSKVETTIQGLGNHYVTLDTYKTQVGDFTELEHSFEGSTVIDEINELHKIMSWQELIIEE